MGDLQNQNAAVLLGFLKPVTLPRSAPPYGISAPDHAAAESGDYICNSKIELQSMGAYITITPIVSKIFCSSLHAVLMVRRRPPAVNGGGFVVTDQEQRIVFSVDGCGIIGASGQLIVRDGDGNAILFIHKKEGVVQALSVNNWWRGYLTDYGEPSKLIFSLQDPKPVLCMKGDVRVIVTLNGRKRHWDYEVTGSFVQRSCAIKSRAGHVVAQIGVKGMMAGKDFYQVVVQPGYDQAFVVGIIAILDNIHGESTRC